MAKAKAKVATTRSKSSVLSKTWSLVAWLTGVLVALAVGFGMVDGVLNIRYVPATVTAVAGWIVVILALLGVILAIIDALNK